MLTPADDLFADADFLEVEVKDFASFVQGRAPDNCVLIVTEN